MQRKTGKIVIFSFLILNVILRIIYQFVIRTRIPYTWWDAHRYMHYPQKIADHLADCFFFMNCFIAGYMVFEEKHYCNGIAEGRLKNKWRYCAQICQIAGLAVYAVLWLGFTDDLLLPIDTPRSYVSMLFYEKLSERQWRNRGYIYCKNLAIILAPAFMFFVLYCIQFFRIKIWQKKVGCFDKKWNTWNIIYIIVFLLVFCWTFEALRGFDLLSKIPVFSSFLREYYRRNPPSIPPSGVF